MIFFYVMLRSYNYVAGCSYQHQNPLPLTLQEVLRKNGDGNTHSGRREEQHPVSRQHPGHSVCADKVRPYRILTPRALAPHRVAASQAFLFPCHSSGPDLPPQTPRGATRHTPVHKPLTPHSCRKKFLWVCKLFPLQRCSCISCISTFAFSSKS
jgi:hypothetical protein